MIADAQVLTDLQSEWAGVRTMTANMKRLVITTFAGGAITGPALRNVLYNLPLLLAFDVLGNVLRQLKRERYFTCGRDSLGPMVDAATSIPWLDWQGIRDGVNRRNDVAHNGQLFTGADCLADIDRIEEQLKAWHVVLLEDPPTVIS